MPQSADDQSPEPAEFSGSDIEEQKEEEEDPELLEEEVEEEEEEEAEAEEEEAEGEENMDDELEGRVEVDMDISDSPIRSHDHHNGQRTSVHLQNEVDGHPCNSEIMDAKATSSCRVGREEMADAIPIRDHLGEEVRSVVNPGDEMKQVDMQQRNGRKQMDSRFFRSGALETGTTTVSPAAETSGRSKRPAIICDFYAKGWCIRGSSCKFLHVKDNLNSSQPHPEGDVANSTREVQLDEGLRDITERSRSPGFRDPLAFSSGSDFAFSSHLSSEKIRFLEHIGRQHQFHEKRKFPTVIGEESNVGLSTDAKKLHSSKDDPGFLSSLKDIERDDQRNWPAVKDKSIFISSLHPEPGFFSTGSISSSGKYLIGKNSSHSSSMEEPAGIWSQRMPRDHSSPLVNLALNSSSRNLSITALFPTSRISSWTGFSLPSSYSNLDSSPHDTLKLFDQSRDYRSSTRSSPLLKSSSPFSSSELKSLPTTVSLRSAEIKTKLSSNDWEPSVPFRPSFILPHAFLSSSGWQYEPLRDSIELPKLANISGEASFYPEGATGGNKLHLQHGESASGTMRPACDGDTNSMSSHNTYHEKVLDNSCYTRDHNSPVTEAETAGTSAVCQNGTMTGEENPLGPPHPKGSTKQNKASSATGDSRHQSDGSRHQEGTKLGRFREKNEVDGEHLTDRDVQQESKAVKNFRAALVDLVKELLKPKWREGSLSKDAHNMIVKRAVEKIISAFQPHQIPSTIETVEQYLSACRPKISKLVEGYVEKYGKS
ncbi:protein FRIGIDA-ESSENTIAL 1 isoform X1 [Pyrus x bretschneideri]|uniref:protein FRIGIDA-ESSENTIAL 1 isoform X1 n=1 Tax=Pyrus x bretschneideri TaxID=225117 RepID=UPI00202E85C8|nr:protein FRIGIDA-ESSENTIAL 1 isoform X1 [Pyrus x bretschneideri]